MATENESAWSTTAATNANVDAGINWAEGQDAASVNNSGRGMMAARAKARRDQGGYLTAGGSANALTVNPTQQVLTAPDLAAGQRLLVRAIADNTSTTVTFAPDGLTAAPIKRVDGSALAVGDILSGAALDLVYNAGSSEWRCLNIAAKGAGRASFRVYRSGDQSVAGTSLTTVTFDSELFDVGSFFAGYAWSPPVGSVMLGANLSGGFITDGSQFTVAIVKNGSTIATNTVTIVGTSPSAAISIIDQCSGSDSYLVRVSSSDASYTVTGGSNASQFWGSMI